MRFRRSSRARLVQELVETLSEDNPACQRRARTSG